MPNWEKFTRQRLRSGDKRVSLNKRGVFSLNQIIYKDLGEPKAVILLFDKKENLVGLQVSNQNAEFAHVVYKQGENNLYVVNARAFCNYYSIDITKSVTFEDIKIEKGILILNLNKTREISQTRKRDTKQK